jgi:hypothetical protein
MWSISSDWGRQLRVWWRRHHLAAIVDDEISEADHFLGHERMAQEMELSSGHGLETSTTHS